MSTWLRAIGAGLGAALTHAALTLTAAQLYSVNTSPSLPLGLYRVVPAVRPRVGDLVLVCLPPDVAALARARGYLTRGRCASGVEPLGKRIAAAAGDTVAVTSAGLVINGHSIRLTVPLRLDSRGRDLPQLVGYRRALGPGELWLVAAQHPRSFDSRYFGPVSIGSVIAVVQPVWTW
jgi:conjugative transfer signal peptidase TraF